MYPSINYLFSSTTMKEPLFETPKKLVPVIIYSSCVIVFHKNKFAQIWSRTEGLLTLLSSTLPHDLNGHMRPKFIAHSQLRFWMKKDLFNKTFFNIQFYTISAQRILFNSPIKSFEFFRHFNLVFFP